MPITKSLPLKLIHNDLELKRIFPKNNEELEKLFNVYKRNKKHLYGWHLNRKELVFKNVDDLRNYQLKNHLSCYGIYLVGNIIGSIELGRPSIDYDKKRFRMINYWVDKNHTRLGIMSICLTMLEKYLFKQDSICLEAEVDSGNEASQKLLKKLGYQVISFSFGITSKAKTACHFATYRKTKNRKKQGNR